MLTTDISSPTRIILDTHIWLWHGEGDSSQYLPSASSMIDKAASDGRLAVSAISIWELAMLEQKGAITLSTELRTWVTESRRVPGVRVLALSPSVLMDGPRLPQWLSVNKQTVHKDPADRWIVATARQTNAVIVTCDREILNYAKQGHVHAFDARP